jgi:dTDP-4-amino-4,6-dideoxygalactose transaminase
MTDKGDNRIFLSPPHLGKDELSFVKEAFLSNYIAPVGPMVDAFEREFSDFLGHGSAAAVSSGTAAIHLALRLCGVGPGDDVFVSTFTFIGSVSPIRFLGAMPVFFDSERKSWNLDPELLVRALKDRAARNRLPRAVVLVHLYGQCADLDPILEACERYAIPVIEDAAEALGATYKGHRAGLMGRCGIFSFNGNKILTTSGGGMLVSEDADLVRKARFLAQQARDPAPHYEHSELGYNYRMSNILAAIGRGQLRVLDERIERKRAIFSHFRDELSDLPGIEFMPEAEYGRSNRWLTCITIDEKRFGADRETVMLALERENIESRPLWKPMHLQPLFKDAECFGGDVSEALFRDGLCLPSGTAMDEADMDRVIRTVRGCRR